MKKQLLILIIFCVSLIGSSQTIIDNFITYDVTSTTNYTVRALFYSTAGPSDVTIPDTVVHNNQTYSVTRIGTNSFINKSITSIILPNSITSIGQNAFYGNQLLTVIIPNSVSTIESLAFASNPITSVFSEATAPPNIVTGGGSDSFASDRSNIHLHIPSGTMGAYVTDSGAQWTGFNPVTQDALSVSSFGVG